MGSLTEPMYRLLPQVGELRESEAYAALRLQYGRALVLAAVRAALAEVRAEIHAGRHTEESLPRCLRELPETVERRLRGLAAPSLRRVVNATGVVLQTNLGRAPLSERALARVAEVAGGYSNLEFDLRTGERGRRDVHAEPLLLDVLRSRGAMDAEGVERRAALVVNNCAAATLLALNTVAEGGEVLVSRGELVEIGGGFRVPDILRKSGAVLREVGTTNRTRVADYAEAITPETRLILRVHRSNFRIEGFTEQPTLGALVALGTNAGVPVFEDQGTGCAIDLRPLGIADESSWLESVRSGAAMVACSGDKLLGGPQCGVVVGDRERIAAMRRNPLYRVLRADKMTYAALGATLEAYLLAQEDTLPAVAMLRRTAESIRLRCEALANALAGGDCAAEVVATESVVGGGTTPGAVLPSYAVLLRHAALSEEEVAAALRAAEVAVVVRRHKGAVLLDLRTVDPADDVLLARQVKALGARAVPLAMVEPGT